MTVPSTKPAGHTTLVGALVREWRIRRNLSQLALSLGAGVSTRHLSFIECGRAMPSAGMILRLCEALRLPGHERNQLLLAGGFAPGDHPFEGPPDVALAEPHESFEGTHGPGTNEQANGASRRYGAGDPELGQGSLAL